MRLYILQRLLSLIPVMLVVAIVVFFLIHLTPGDPASIILGPEALPEDVDKLREEMGLDLPILEQFLIWFGGIFKGDLGWSPFMDMPVMEAFLSHLGPTLSLAILAQIISIVIAIPFGIIAATKRGTAIDQFFMVFALLGISIPSFLLGLLLILLFAVKLQWLPVAGYQPLGTGFWNHLKFLILPAITLGAIQAALIARMTRSSMLDILNMNYIKTAHAKGLKERVVIFKHAFRNAFIPILTVIGQSFGTLIAGAVVTEVVFNIPGIGQLIVNSIQRRDYVVIQGAVLLIAGAYVLINLIVDLLYGVVDPRVRLNKK
ncbi:ABC transporter permease [Bacillus norwichensis]|uniref:ABC transporter permease n=1 Tax=Bacillus norwichensis TaxID=2762217 RepID=A0ABR8VMZ8_9BACI|nr:ABC transporter permease [Bacillus norwichensis]MBD8005966.1 ABC transporter permease [Bacillus norwichensis]